MYLLPTESPVEREGSCQDAKEVNKEKPKVIKQWLSRQSFWQVHSPPRMHVASV